MSGSSVACGVFVVLTPTKCNHCALRAFLQVDGRKNQQGFEEQDQEAHVLEAPPLPVSPQIFRQESSAEAGCKVTKKTKGTAKAVARIVDEKKRFKIKWRGYQAQIVKSVPRAKEIATKCFQLARQGRRKKAVEKLKERLKAS
ncbi:unnamed protein product [Cladocopium goreaui]|uniref:Uncharacterized protein n=1 Tax=Cladocopium goreaui TaxID=2562237 RepID=A0A9P1CPU4_9DINO|nr:unnamed protein product [Cladocopium goreaui]